MSSSSTIWVLGAGQLGAMLQTAGRPLNLDVRPVDIESASAPALQPDDLVTAEREQWPASIATDALAAHARFVNRDVFGLLADRKTQKSLIDELHLATAPWQAVEANTTEAALHTRLGERVLLKRRTGGYDGRGQHWLRQPQQDTIPSDWYGQAIAEQAIAFDEEVSLVGARDAQGNCVFYPLTLNLHVNGILLGSVAPLNRLAHLQAQAEHMLSALLNKLNYVGVMAMECFRTGDHLMINELAPRVHNSGHWTQAGASINQFELHLRGVSGLPLGSPVIKGTNVMVNLVGTEQQTAWLAVQGAEQIWYGKEVRPGRKVGHINFCGNSAGLKTSLSALQNHLPDNYADVIAWLTAQLDSDHPQ
ncbi:5-(carboxyamino)imidazole ribonucleotide synthase [Cellvibrio polysaccharolyticus]|uniref:N5-carboxyaminoimidazole ribonucleotide synthase n=1 Tax=Cellvibrio polysaccharolyticus TaxID=2082724 RepID=A0A928YT90_9GAMM|nr:5-(carboxyamino)imidazole ribonucleotide synthase [Cellvibrio polysaccharolyticus]MBE8716759.1 5-(carboxyamino)imidazole ribonucleotide synthase [Cellvibrio polysaccharolyticus]